MHIDHLVTMANEVAAFFQGASDQAQAANDIAAHFKRYWDPRMRKQIVGYVKEGGEGLVPLARAAIELLSSGNRSADAVGGG